MGLFRKQGHLKNDSNMTVIATETRLKGEITSQHNIQIDGHFEGTINCSAAVIVSEIGRTTSVINTEEIYIYGTLNGKINATKVFIGEKGNVNATIISDQLAIMEGGHFVGEKQDRTISPENSALPNTATKTELPKPD